MKDKHYLYENYWDNSPDNDYSDIDDETPPSRKAIAIGVIISVAVVLGALRLWNVFQRP